MIRNPIQTYRTDATICILQSVWVRMYSPPCKGADGVVAHKLHFALRLETWRVSEHPVCGASVASRLFTYAPTTPPLERSRKHASSTVPSFLTTSLSQVSYTLIIDTLLCD